MPSFTTRVVLHGADGDDYNDLHEEMEKRGFTRTITSSTGVVYDLPDAEYDYVGNVTRAQVLERAKAAAAAATEKKRGVLVTEAAGRSWIGLSEA
jgi:hypothetical protein